MLPSIGPAPATKLDFNISQRLILQNLQTPEADGSSFMGMLSGGIDAVNQSQLSANQQVQAMLTGEDVSEAEVLTAVQKADMSFRLLMQIRNKLLAAYEELNAIRV